MSLRRLLALASIASLLAVAAPAAADGKAACVEAHSEAQTLRRTGKLRAARERLAICAVPACPPLVTNDCAEWLSAVTAEQPTIVVRARDARGEPTLAVKIVADGELIAPRLDGTAIALDPGEHVLRFELADGSATTRRVVMTEGEKNHLVEVELAPPADRSAPASAPSPRPPLLAFVSGGVAAISVGVFSAFAISGLSRESELTSSCAPGCAQRDIDDLARRYAIADVAFVVAIASAGLATWLFVDHARRRPAASARVAIPF